MQLTGRNKWAALIAIATMAAGARDVYACAMCGLPMGDSMTHAYNTSVIFMMAVPYSIFMIGAVVGFFAYRNAYKRRINAADAGAAPQPLPNR
jgi:hypothetical protein